MPKLPRNILKSFFERGDHPTQEQFAALIDSNLNILEDRSLLGLKIFNTAVPYYINDTAIYNGFIYQAIENISPGQFNGSQWEKISFSALNLAGTWDAANNVPALQSSIGNKGDYYIVSVSGNTQLNAVTSWSRLDFAVFSGSAWEKISAAATDALHVSFDPIPSGMNSNNVQDAIDEIQLRVDTTETNIGTLQNAKADKVTTASPGKLPVFASQGDLVESSRSLDDYLHKTNTVLYVPTELYHPATKDYVDVAILGAAAKPGSPIDGHFAGLDATGNLTDSGFQPSDYLHKTNTAPFEPTSDFHPATKKYVDGRVANPNNITQDSTHKFVTDTQISTWDNKEDALGFTPVPDSRTISGHALTADISLVKGDVGLGNVDNTSDAGKPISTATQTALNGKQDILGFTAVPNTRTISGHALSADISLVKGDVGLGNVDNTSDAGKPISTATQTALNAKQDSSSFASTALATVLTGLSTATNAVITATDSILSAFGKLQKQISDNLATFNARTVNGHALSANVTVTKSDVGLGNVTNDQQLSQKQYSTPTGTFNPTSNPSFVSPNVASVNFTPAVTGNHLIEWYFEVQVSASNGVAGGQVMLGASVIGNHLLQPGVTGTWAAFTGFYMANLSAGASTISIYYNHPAGSGTTSFRNPRIKFTQV